MKRTELVHPTIAVTNINDNRAVECSLLNIVVVLSYTKANIMVDSAPAAKRTYVMYLSHAHLLYLKQTKERRIHVYLATRNLYVIKQKHHFQYTYFMYNVYSIGPKLANCTSITICAGRLHPSGALFTRSGS